jgi:outer membrane protein OmpA-like peptidoglycan-associated protein
MTSELIPEADESPLEVAFEQLARRERRSKFFFWAIFLLPLACVVGYFLATRHEQSQLRARVEQAASMEARTDSLWLTLEESGVISARASREGGARDLENSLVALNQTLAERGYREGTLPERIAAFRSTHPGDPGESQIRDHEIVVATVNFDSGSAEVSSAARLALKQSLSEVSLSDLVQLAVRGNTDSVGEDAYNYQLARSRAEAVAAELRDQVRVDIPVTVESDGERRLINRTVDGVSDPQNRTAMVIGLIRAKH